MSWKLNIFWKRIISKSYLKNNKNWWTNLKEYHHFGNVTHKSGTPGCSKGRYAYEVHENGPIFKTSHAPCPASSKISPPFLTFDLVHFQKNPHPSPNDNQSIKRKTGWLFYVRYFLQVGFRFSINSVILSGFPMVLSI